MQAAGLRVVANSPIRRVLNNPSEELGAAGVSAAGPWPMRGLCVRVRVGAVGVPILLYSVYLLCVDMCFGCAGALSALCAFFPSLCAVCAPAFALPFACLVCGDKYCHRSSG